MANTKVIVNVFVGTPVADAYSNSGRSFVRIQNRESVDLAHRTLKDTISRLNALQRKYGDKYADMTFDPVRDCGCRYDCGCSPTLYLKGKRYETDLEFNLRIAEEAKRDEERKQRDERELAAIAKRLGKVVVDG